MAARSGNAIGSTTRGAATGAGAGAGVGASLAEILVTLIPALEGLSAPLTVLLSALIAYGAALLSGKFIPTDQKPDRDADYTPVMADPVGEPVETITVAPIPDPFSGIEEHPASGKHLAVQGEEDADIDVYSETDLEELKDRLRAIAQK